MEGMVHAAQRQFELAISTAWHTAVFALNGYAGKLEDLSHYLGRAATTDEDREREENARLIHFFHQMKARGVPVEISRRTLQ
jgi:hypothetical protein